MAKDKRREHEFFYMRKIASGSFCFRLDDMIFVFGGSMCQNEVLLFFSEERYDAMIGRY